MTDFSSVLSQFTRLTDRRTDEQTNGETPFSLLDRVCIPCSAVNSKRRRKIIYGDILRDY